jgi:hypothetical protein
MPNIPHEDFTQLVAQMAELQHKYESRARNGFSGKEGIK